MSFLGKKTGTLDGTFIYEESEWKGRQRVLKEHQAKENLDRRKCITEEVKSLKKSNKSKKKQ